MEEHDPSKWHWMMKWCRESRVPPGDSYWWKRAEKAYDEFKSKEQQRHGAGE
jgi:hypothetical protein